MALHQSSRLSAARRTAVVTGASGSIGQAIARKLVGSGCRVVNIDLVSPADTLDDEVYLPCDLTDREATQKMSLEVARDYRPTCLVNNAAWASVATFDDTTVEDFDRTLAVNVIAAHILCIAIVPSMREIGFGQIVNISSVAARGKRARAAYAASKAAIEGYTKVLAIELGGDGITVNAVAPGPIDTPAFQAANPPGSPGRNAIEAQHWLQVWACPKISPRRSASSFFMKHAS